MEENIARIDRLFSRCVTEEKNENGEGDHLCVLKLLQGSILAKQDDLRRPALHYL